MQILLFGMSFGKLFFYKSVIFPRISGFGPLDTWESFIFVKFSEEKEKENTVEFHTFLLSLLAHV